MKFDEALLMRAKRVLGQVTLQATIEEALRRVVNDAERERGTWRARQVEYLASLGDYADLEILASEEVWR